MLKTIFSLGIATLVSATISLELVCAQSFPTKPIRIITSAAGGGADFTARLVAQGITAPLGQPVIVENRGSPILSGEFAAKAPADGYTLLIAGSGTWIRPLLAKMPFDPVHDFAPISLVEMAPNIVTVHPSMPIKSIKQLIGIAKARPGDLNFASTGAGSSGHLSGELFKAMTGVNLAHVPYKGAAPALTALLSGEVQLTFSTMAAVIPHIKSGRLRALAITSSKPSALVPELPTVATTVPGYQSVSSNGLFAPAKTSDAIIARINQEVVRNLSRTEVKEKFLSAGVETVGSSPEELAAIIKADMTAMGKVIKDAGIRAD